MVPEAEKNGLGAPTKPGNEWSDKGGENTWDLSADGLLERGKTVGQLDKLWWETAACRGACVAWCGALGASTYQKYRGRLVAVRQPKRNAKIVYRNVA